MIKFLGKRKGRLIPPLFYYLKKPSQLRHSLMVAKFYSYFQKRYSIKKFNIEPTYGKIRPDAAFVYVQNGISEIGLLEVELSKKGFNWGKYEQFIGGNNYHEYMTKKPKLFIVSDHVKPVSNCKVDFEIFKTSEITG